MQTKTKPEPSKTLVLDAQLATVQKQRDSIQVELDKIADTEDRKAQLTTAAEALDMSIEVLKEAVEKGNPPTDDMVDEDLKTSDRIPE